MSDNQNSEDVNASPQKEEEEVPETKPTGPSPWQIKFVQFYKFIMTLTVCVTVIFVIVFLFIESSLPDNKEKPWKISAWVFGALGIALSIGFTITFYTLKHKYPDANNWIIKSE